MFSLVSRAFADASITVSSNLPGMPAGSTANPAGYINGFYSLALIISGILAFGAIVYGGIKYAVGKGNPSSETEGKAWITSALLGLLLLAGAYLILYTVNPQIVSLGIQGVTSISAPAASGGGGGGGGNPNATGCAAGSCQSLSGGGFDCKAAAQQPGGVNSCSAAQGMIDTLKCLQQNGAPGLLVTEAMPPTVPHQSKCHNTGCCVDVQVKSGSCADVQKVMNALSACGATAANEYSGCGGKTYDTTTGNNVHINSAAGGGC